MSDKVGKQGILQNMMVTFPDFDLQFISDDSSFNQKRGKKYKFQEIYFVCLHISFFMNKQYD